MATMALGNRNTQQASARACWLFLIAGARSAKRTEFEEELRYLRAALMG
jgi:hypothetical protein